ncbi:hypothetical protein P691DRAFT_552508 [Macrolepiota fuliginosa MF-IS2]|uniref:Uncharacterized protein n=1 Tax=Macrolepiota fuliginosa MF-IS2 TaxID=1400762 RepID=A0A9P5XH69_9AGAR|nr:hypothetical protein P691DRAFT_552508 [Macrolepiota fuliginosa MF-IS2]
MPLLRSLAEAGGGACLSAGSPSGTLLAAGMHLSSTFYVGQRPTKWASATGEIHYPVNVGEYPGGPVAWPIVAVMVVSDNGRPLRRRYPHDTPELGNGILWYKLKIVMWTDRNKLNKYPNLGFVIPREILFPRIRYFCLQLS